jgi:hypothetical protein
MNSVSGDTPEKSWAASLEGLLRHPLTSIIVGFVLTGIVGTLVTNHFADLRQQEARSIERHEARRKAIVEVSRLFSERLGRAEALSVAIEGRATKEVIGRLKQLYDDAETRAAVVRQEVTLLMREAMLESDFERLRSDVDTHLTTRRMRPLHDCFDRAAARILAGGDGAAVLRECRSAQLIEEARACSDVITDGLYDLASLPALGPAHQDVVERARTKTRDQIARACP